MSDRADRRRRSNIRQYSAEDQALNQISKEAETRLQAKRAARAEAREIRLKEIEKQQKEQEKQDRINELATDNVKSRQLSGSRRNSTDSTESMDSRDRERDLKGELRELEEKYRQAMMTSATLDNEKQTLVFQLELMKDQLEELEEAHTELTREHKDRCRDLEMKRRAFTELEAEVKVLKEHMVLKDQLIEESGFVIMSTETGEYKLEKNTSMSNGPVPTGGSVLLSTQAVQILKEAGDGSLGTATQPCRSSAQVHDTKTYSYGVNKGADLESCKALPESHGNKEDDSGKTEPLRNPLERIGKQEDQGSIKDEIDAGGTVSVENLASTAETEKIGAKVVDDSEASVNDFKCIDEGDGLRGSSSVDNPENLLVKPGKEVVSESVSDSTDSFEVLDDGSGDSIEVLSTNGNGRDTAIKDAKFDKSLASHEDTCSDTCRENVNVEEKSTVEISEAEINTDKDGDGPDLIFGSSIENEVTRSRAPTDLDLSGCPNDRLPRDDSGIFSPGELPAPGSEFTAENALVKIIEPVSDEEEGDEFFDAVSTPSPYLQKDCQYDYLGSSVDPPMEENQDLLGLESSAKPGGSTEADPAKDGTSVDQDLAGEEGSAREEEDLTKEVRKPEHCSDETATTVGHSESVEDTISEEEATGIQKSALEGGSEVTQDGEMSKVESESCDTNIVNEPIDVVTSDNSSKGDSEHLKDRAQDLQEETDSLKDDEDEVDSPDTDEEELSDEDLEIVTSQDGRAETALKDSVGIEDPSTVEERQEINEETIESEMIPKDVHVDVSENKDVTEDPSCELQGSAPEDISVDVNLGQNDDGTEDSKTELHDCSFVKEYVESVIQKALDIVLNKNTPHADTDESVPKINPMEELQREGQSATDITQTEGEVLDKTEDVSESQKVDIEKEATKSEHDPMLIEGKAELSVESKTESESQNVDIEREATISEHDPLLIEKKTELAVESKTENELINDPNKDTGQDLGEHSKEEIMFENKMKCQANAQHKAAEDVSSQNPEYKPEVSDCSPVQSEEASEVEVDMVESKSTIVDVIVTESNPNLEDTGTEAQNPPHPSTDGNKSDVSPDIERNQSDVSGESDKDIVSSKKESSSSQPEPKLSPEKQALKQADHTTDSDDDVFIKETVALDDKDREVQDDGLAENIDARMKSEGEMSEEDLLNDAYSFDDIDDVLEDLEDSGVSPEPVGDNCPKSDVKIIVDLVDDVEEEKEEVQEETKSVDSSTVASSTESFGSTEVLDRGSDRDSIGSGADGGQAMTAPPSPKESKKGKKFGKFFKSIFK